MKLNQLGRAHTYQEPVGCRGRSGMLAQHREGTGPFEIKWDDGEIESIEPSSKRANQVIYCPEMNLGQEFVISLYARYGQDHRTVATVMGSAFARLGDERRLEPFFRDYIDFNRDDKGTP